jgi:hypothetical protein
MQHANLKITLCSLLSAAAGFGLATFRFRETPPSRDTPSTFTRLESAASSAHLPSKNTTSIPKPEGFEAFDSLSEILAAAGPMGRFQAMLAHIQDLPRGKIESTLRELSEQMGAGRLDAETMFATHLLLVRFGAEDPTGAMAYLKTRDFITQGLGMGTVLASLASKDPNMAVAYFSDPENAMMKIPQVGDVLAGALAKEWASRDAKAAIAWAESLEGGQKTGALNGIIGTLAADDPARAAAMAADVSDAKDREGLYNRIARSWAAQDPDSALAWVGKLGDDERPQALRQAVSGWASRDGAAAAAYLDNLGSPEIRNSALPHVVGPWALKEPSAAATWLAAQDEGAGKAKSMGPLMGIWTATDPEAASTWLTKQPPGPSKDEGIVTMASQVFLTDPASAMAWGATISDTDTRGDKLKQGYSLWSRADANAAAAWLESADLSVEDKADLMPPLSPNQPISE